MRKRLIAALQTSDPAASVDAFARELVGEGVKQPDLYVLFASQQECMSGQEPGYDSVVDTLDLVISGPWAKGKGLFPQEHKPL